MIKGILAVVVFWAFIGVILWHPEVALWAVIMVIVVGVSVMLFNVGAAMP